MDLEVTKPAPPGLDFILEDDDEGDVGRRPAPPRPPVRRREPWREARAEWML